VVKPGTTLTGEIQLRQAFPELTVALEKRDVIVFWSYQLTPLIGRPPGRVGDRPLPGLGGRPLPRVGGWLLIPKLQQ
jgi:hypothetical protein